MKLNKYQKENIARRIMADVPTVNYEEQAKDVLLKAAIDRLPPAVRRVYDNPETRCYVKHGRWTSGGMSFHLPFHSSEYLSANDLRREGFPEEALKEFSRLSAAHEQQRDKRRAMERTLLANFQSVGTAKSFAARFPQFAHYLPTDIQPAKNLPATTELFDALAGMGWIAPPADAQPTEQ